MKSLLTLLLFSLIGILGLQAQDADFVPSGKPTAKVFLNYHYNLADVNQKSSFEITRAYFGYKYSFAKNFSTEVKLDVGSNAAGSSYTAFLKVAKLDWKVAKSLKLSMGLMGMKQFNDQEKQWGYRYIYKSFMDQNGFGSSADLGINANIKIHKMLSANIFVVNGGGYKNLQDNYGMQRVGANIIAKPIDGLTLKVYYDMMGNKFDKYGNDSIIADTSTISNLAFFAGYKADKFRLGAEYNMLSNAKKYSKYAADHSLNGISVYGTFIINKQFEVFARFDQLASNTLSGATDAWNLSKDGSAIIAGIQYAPVKGVKMALNFQNFNYKDTNKDAAQSVYLNFEYKF